MIVNIDERGQGYPHNGMVAYQRCQLGIDPYPDWCHYALQTDSIYFLIRTVDVGLCQCDVARFLLLLGLLQ